MSIAKKFCDFIHNQEKKKIPSILLISSSLQNFLIRNKKKKKINTILNLIVFVSDNY